MTIQRAYYVGEEDMIKILDWLGEDITDQDVLIEECEKCNYWLKFHKMILEMKFKKEFIK